MIKNEWKCRNYGYMWGGQVALEDIETALKEIKNK